MEQTRGWLLYDPADLARNQWMIAELCAYAQRQGWQLRLVQSNHALPTRWRGQLVLTDATHPEERPDCIVNRSRAPMWSAPYEALGIPVWNCAAVTAITNDKWLTACFLAAHGLPIPPTQRLSRKAPHPSARTASPSHPLVIKPCRGHGGAGVALVRSPAEAEAAIAALPEDAFLVQTPMRVGWDMRVFVLGNQIYQTVLRTSTDDFRSNYSLGGQIQLTVPPAEIVAMVQAICRVLPLDFAGIDFLCKPDGGYVIGELEDAVGCRMLYALTARNPVADWMQTIARPFLLAHSTRKEQPL